MSRKNNLAIAVAFTAMVALPSVSDAHCLGLNRMEAGITQVADGVGHMVRRLSDRMMHVGDRVVGWMFCGHRHA